MLHWILTIVQLFSAVAVIGLVLLQRGKGAEAGAGFGAGASGTVFGAKGATTALSRATAIFAAIFMINSLLLSYVGTRAVAAPPKTILDTIGEKADKANGTKPGVTQTIPAPADTPAAGETAPTSAPAGAGTDATASTPPPAPTTTPAPAAAPASAPASAPTQPATGTPPANGATPK